MQRTPRQVRSEQPVPTSTFRRGRRGHSHLRYETLFCCIALTFAAPHAAAQQDPAETIALEFQTSLQRLGWDAAAYRMHPEGLQAFKQRVTIFVEADTTGITRTVLFGEISAQAYTSLAPSEVFSTIMERFETDLPGILNAWSARDVEILGTVAEGADTRHVLYRNHEWMGGSKPQLRVMTLQPHDGEWRVVTSPELEAVPEALRGLLGILRRRATGGSASPGPRR